MVIRPAALLVVVLSLVVAAGGASLADAAHPKRHKVCHRGKGKHRHKVKCPKPKKKHPTSHPKGCVALPPTGSAPGDTRPSTPGAANGQVVLEAGAGSGGTVTLLGRSLHE